MLLTIFKTPIWSFYIDADFNSAKENCLALEKKSTSKMYSNVGGFQSDDIEIESISTEIHKGINEIVDALSNEIGVGLSVGKKWVNVNRKNNYNISHHHGSSAFSGVIYIATPLNCGNIVFQNPATSGFSTMPPTVLGYEDRVIIPAETGRMVIFPSYLSHYVEMNNSEEPRISMAFNLGGK
jgi:uncharacterized protein (TIGR02466 family)